jgi:DNA-directed RNA polymerase subunit M/transcription elongation factor TFIIS
MREAMYQSKCPECGNIDIVSETESKNKIHCQRCYHHYIFLINLDPREIIRHSERKDEIIKELISLNLWQARRLYYNQYKDFAYEELEKNTDEKYERL